MPRRRVFGIHKINNTDVRLRSQPRDGPAKRRGVRTDGRTDGPCWKTGASGGKGEEMENGEVETHGAKYPSSPRFCGQRSLTSDHLEITYMEFSDLCREHTGGKKISRWLAGERSVRHMKEVLRPRGHSIPQ